MGSYKRSSRPLKSQKGVALLMALVSLSLLMFIAIEVGYDSTVDYVVSRQQVDRISAYYSAKAGIEISLLRVALYRQYVGAAASVAGAQGGGAQAASMLDPIWSFPLMWPVPTTLPGVKTTEMDRDMIKDAVEESIMVGQYTTTISPEGGKIDINELGSYSCKPPPEVSPCSIMRDQVLKIFKSELEQNEKFQRKYSTFRFEELVNNIADYVDEDSEGRNGGDESSIYREVTDREVKMPPNRPFRTLDELHQVAGMTDDLYTLLANRVTIFGTKGININYANKEVLMALDPSMTDVAVTKAIARRNDKNLGGPFTSADDFLNFVQPFGVNIQRIKDSKIPLLTGAELNFRITSTGLSSNVKREITVVTYDMPELKKSEIHRLDARDKRGQERQQIPADSAKGRPTVVYWEEN